MSKIGQKPVIVPASVQVETVSGKVSVKGPKGTLEYTLPDFITLKREGEVMTVERATNSKPQKAMHGLYRSIIANAVKGVTEGWTKRLEIVGTGFNVKMQGAAIALKVGYSHPVVYKAAEGIQLSTDGNNIIIVSGADKQLVGQTAYQIITVRQPDIYKGKGIRYEGQRIKLKPGKKAKAA